MLYIVKEKFDNQGRLNVRAVLQTDGRVAYRYYDTFGQRYATWTLPAFLGRIRYGARLRTMAA